MPTDLSGWRKIRASIKEAAARNARVKCGVLSTAGMHESGISLAELAIIHELGAPGVGLPARSFVGKTMELRDKDLRDFIAKVVASYVEDRITLNQALAILGQWVVAAIKNTITSEQVTPPDKPETIARKAKKGHNGQAPVTLVDTGQLINAISYEVVGGPSGTAEHAPEPPESEGTE